MRDIPLDEKPSALPVNSFLIAGDTRSGKSEFAATFPRPLIFADVTEGGYKTVQKMDRNKWFEGPNGPAPIIKGIDKLGDLAQVSPEVDALIASKRVMTIVFDAWSYYCDFFMAGLVRLQTKVDDRKIFGDLGKHLREVRTNYGIKGVNLVWNCLVKHPNDDDPKGRPMIPGQQGDKFAAGCDFLLHSRVERTRTGPGGKEVITTYELRTKQYGAYIVGNRLGIDADMLPDPFVGSYSDFIAALGYDVDAVRAAMPKPGPVKPIVAQAAPVANKPPVVVTSGKPPINNSAPKVVTVTSKAGNHQVK